MEPIEFKHKMIAEDYGNFLVFIAFDRKAFNRIFINILMPLLGLALIIMSIVLQIEDFLVYFWSILVLCFGLLFRVLYRFLGKAAFKKTPLLGLENTYTFSDEDILGVNERGQQKFFYDDIGQVYETKEYLYIAFGGSLFIFLSKARIGYQTSEQIKRLFVNKIPDKCKFIPKK